MPMIDIQRRHATVFRIRFGDKTNNGAPRKLTDRIRITAPSRPVVEAFTDVYGGEITEWEGQWETYLPTQALNILVLPGQSLSQWWEKYRGSVCERRCDGETETKSGKPCMCPPDIDDRMADRNGCQPTTRVNVLCPDVAVVGSGALVTHGLIAAETLPQSIAVAEAALSRGLMVPAVLRVVEFRGRNHFIVPQIEIVGVSLNELTTGERRAELVHATHDPLPPTTAGALPAGASLRPVPVDDLPPGPQPTVAEQMGTRPTPVARKNAAAPIPSTGVKPRTAAAAESGGSARVCVRCGQPLGTAPIVKEGGGYAHKACPDGDATEPEPEPAEDVAPEPTGEWEPSEAKITALAKQAFASAYDGAAHGQKTKTLDRLRYALTWVLTGGSATSMNDLDAGRKRELLDWLGWVRDGRVAWDVDDDGVTFTLVGSDRGPVHVAWSAFEDVEAAAS